MSYLLKYLVCFYITNWDKLFAYNYLYAPKNLQKVSLEHTGGCNNITIYTVQSDFEVQRIFLDKLSKQLFTAFCCHMPTFHFHRAICNVCVLWIQETVYIFTGHNIKVQTQFFYCVKLAEQFLKANIPMALHFIFLHTTIYMTCRLYVIMNFPICILRSASFWGSRLFKSCFHLI